MTNRTRPDLAERIAPGASLLVDSSVVLAYLTGDEPTSELATELFDALIATGRNPASLSMVTVGEILVRPFRRGPASVALAEGFLRHFAEMRLVDVTYEVAREAARLRALTDLPMPDALIISSALAVEADASPDERSHLASTAGGRRAGRRGPRDRRRPRLGFVVICQDAAAVDSASAFRSVAYRSKIRAKSAACRRSWAASGR